MVRTRQPATKPPTKRTRTGASRALVVSDESVDSNLIAHIPNPELREMFVSKASYRGKVF